MRKQLSGYIVDDDAAEVYRWYGATVCCPSDIRQMLAEMPPGETLDLEINSPGGSVAAGYEMYSVLLAATCPTRAEIQSIAASAASVAMLGCDRITATPVAQVVIHLPMTATEGNKIDHQRSIQALESLTESILNAYELKCKGKKTRAELRQMMRVETWMPVQDALAAGIVDEVLYDEAGVIASQMVNCVGSGIRAIAGFGGLPDYQTVKQAYDDAHKDYLGDEEIQLTIAKAKVELEKMKMGEF